MGDFRSHPILKTFLSYYRDRTAGFDKKIIEDFFRGMNDKYDKIIISEETFCHDFMPSKKLSFGGIDKAAKTIEFINAIPIEKKKIVLTIKKQASLLVSTYTHFLHRHGETRSFSNWIENEINLDNLSWLNVVDQFDDTFGHDNVAVVPLEISKIHGISGYVNSVFNGLELRAKHFDTDIADYHNPSPSLKAVSLIRKINKDIKMREKSVIVNNFLISQFPIDKYGKFNPQHNVLNLVNSKYSDENMVLAKRKFSDVADVFS